MCQCKMAIKIDLLHKNIMLDWVVDGNHVRLCVKTVTVATESSDIQPFQSSIRLLLFCNGFPRPAAVGTSTVFDLFLSGGLASPSFFS